jgi:hypothetical protein
VEEDLSNCRITLRKIIRHLKNFYGEGPDGILWRT